MKVIFADIDGVLNSKRWLQALGNDAEAYPKANIDRSAVAVLNHVIRETHAKVVISSTWRKNRYDGYTDIVHYLQSTLNDFGFIGHVVDVTPDFFELRQERRYKPYNRGDEIKYWLDQYAANCSTPDDYITNFVILDDEDDMGALLPHLVQTTHDDGLLIVHLPALLAKLA